MIFSPCSHFKFPAKENLICLNLRQILFFFDLSNRILIAGNKQGGCLQISLTRKDTFLRVYPEYVIL